MTEDVPTLLARALERDPEALRELVATVTPTIQVRVVRALWRRRGSSGRDPQQEVEDLTQDVLVALFTDGARPLRAWDPARGMSLLNFVGLVAEHVVANVMVSGRKSPWRDVPVIDPDLERRLDADAGHELPMLSRDLLARVVERMQAALSPRGLELFYALIIDETAIETVVAQTGMTAEALYAWRSRLLKLARTVASELAEVRPGRPGPSGTLLSPGKPSNESGTGENKR